MSLLILSECLFASGSPAHVPRKAIGKEALWVAFGASLAAGSHSFPNRQILFRAGIFALEFYRIVKEQTVDAPQSYQGTRS